MTETPQVWGAKWFVVFYGVALGFCRIKGSKSKTDGSIAPSVWGVYLGLFGFGKGLYNPKGYWCMNGLTSTFWFEAIPRFRTGKGYFFRKNYSLSEKRFVEGRLCA